MSDSGSKGVGQIISESVIKPTMDTFGEMVEEGMHTVTGTPKNDPAQKSDNPNKPDPQQIKADDSVKIRNWNKYLQDYQAQESRFAQQNAQTEQAKKQEEVKKDQDIKQFEFNKKQEGAGRQAALQQAKTRAERKNVGAG